MYRLVLTRQQFEQALTALLRQPESVAVGALGRQRTATGLTLLGQRLTVLPATAPLPLTPDRLVVRLARPPALLHDTSWSRRVLASTPAPGHLTVWLTLGADSLRGQGTGIVLDARGQQRPLTTVTLVGPEMATLTFAGPAAPADPAPDILLDGHWSRTIGALGGVALWRQVTALHVCLVGVSRSGSLIAATLAQLGVHKLTLIDPDVVEAHLLDAMDSVTPEDCGRQKVDAVAARLRTLRPDLDVLALPCRVTERPALTAITEADVVFCGVDNDATRLLVTTLATLYLKPLIDIGTGISFAPPVPGTFADTPTAPAIAPRQMGGDVRCLVPAEACLLCAGGLAREDEARQMLATWSPQRATGTGAHWHAQRAGSLRTVNHLAAHLGVQMWLDLVAGRLRTSRWAQLEWDQAGNMQVHYPALLSGAASCHLCARAGLGDVGMGWEGAG